MKISAEPNGVASYAPEDQYRAGWRCRAKAALGLGIAGAALRARRGTSKLALQRVGLHRAAPLGHGGPSPKHAIVSGALTLSAMFVVLAFISGPSIAQSLAEPAAGAAAPRPPWFEVERLPDRVASAPAIVDLSSPRATARSFFTAADAGHFEEAAITLTDARGLDLPPAELARRLYQVFERQVWLGTAVIPDRTDGARQPTSAAASPAPRRIIDFGSLEIGRFAVTIRLARFKADGHDAIWLFDEATVRAIPALYDRHGPGWLERRLPAWWQADTGLGVRRWEFVALPAVTLAAWLVARLIGLALARSERLISTPWLRIGAKKARLPLALMGAGITARLALGSPLGFSAIVTLIADPLLVALIAAALVLAVLRVIDAGLDMVTRRYVGEIDDRHSRDERRFYTSMYALRRLVTLLAVLGGAGAVLLELDVFSRLGYSLLASAGVLSVTLGVAAQTVLGNILASLQIAIAKPVRIGDSILYEGRWAFVEAIYYTYVRLRTWDEKRLIVPVQYFISNPFENWSMIDARTIQKLVIVVDHAADIAAIRDRFAAIVAEDDDAMDAMPSAVQVIDHDAAGIHLRCFAAAADPTTAWNLHLVLREKLLAWIGENHPEWWPRERIADNGGRTNTRRAAAVTH